MNVELYVDDAGFVRAPASAAYRRLADLGGWPDWWPGTRTRARGPQDDEPVWAVELAATALRRIRLRARVHGHRPDLGLVFDLAGDIDGEAELWLEPVPGGTVVHHLLRGTTSLHRPLAVQRHYRRAMRRGLWCLKDTLQLDVRVSAGLTP